MPSVWLAPCYSDTWRKIFSFWTLRQSTSRRRIEIYRWQRYAWSWWWRPIFPICPPKQQRIQAVENNNTNVACIRENRAFLRLTHFLLITTRTEIHRRELNQQNVICFRSIGNEVEETICANAWHPKAFFFFPGKSCSYFGCFRVTDLYNVIQCFNWYDRKPFTTFLLFQKSMKLSEEIFYYSRIFNIMKRIYWNCMKQWRVSDPKQ